MSLLLDALKRAEQEKLARGTSEPAKPARPDSSGFDMESPRMAPISAPVLELQPVESTPAGQASPSSAEAKAVQNAFAAKAAAAPAPRQRMALWLGLGAIVLVVAGAGGYIWYSIQQLTPPPFTPRARPRPPAAPTPPAASTEPSSAAKMEQLVALANAKPAPPVGVVTPSAPEPAPPTPAPATSASPAAAPARAAAPTALAGLAALSAAAAPDGLEAQLRADLARGESGPLHFALGNLYASQGRWGEAQAEYFEAHRFDPGNADILFDLAVSLDHLGQARLATGYYERALDAASRQAAQFDPSAVGRRLAQLRASARP